VRRLATRVPTGLTARKYAHSESESGRSILTDRPVVAPFVDTRTDPPTDVSVNFCAQASSTTKEEDTLRSGLGPDDLPDLMNGEDLGILATRRPDDSIMLSPVWWERRDEAFYIWAEDDSDRKVRHIERDPRVTFLVPNQHRPYQGYESGAKPRSAATPPSSTTSSAEPRLDGMGPRPPRSGCRPIRSGSSYGSNLASNAAGRSTDDAERIGSGPVLRSRATAPDRLRRNKGSGTTWTTPFRCVWSARRRLTRTMT
jgi:hypothetical protein